MEHVRVDTLNAGDVILPPAREMSLWMRRRAKDRGLPESVLRITIGSIREGEPDKRGRWIVVEGNMPAEWSASPFTFKARPETAWPRVAVGAFAGGAVRSVASMATGGNHEAR